MNEIGVAAERHEVGGRLNNRAENSHQPFRRRERAMQRFRSPKTLQKFSSVHAQVHNQFNQERHLVTRQVYKQRRSAALAEWRALAAQIAAREMAVALHVDELRYFDTFTRQAAARKVRSAIGDQLDARARIPSCRRTLIAVRDGHCCAIKSVTPHTGLRSIQELNTKPGIGAQQLARISARECSNASAQRTLDRSPFKLETKKRDMRGQDLLWRVIAFLLRRF